MDFSSSYDKYNYNFVDGSYSMSVHANERNYVAHVWLQILALCVLVKD